jgi:hypothetical protein
MKSNIRAHNEDQKKEICDRLYQAWIKNPDLRLAQLILIKTYKLYDIFYVDDYELIELIEDPTL